MSIHNVQTELANGTFSQDGRDMYHDRLGFMRAWGNTVPSDAATGYATGCIFHHLDGATGDVILYVNIGDTDSCDFDAVVVSGATASVGALTVSGLTIGSTALAATAAEINRAADVSTRLVAGGSSLAVNADTHDGKTILLDTAAGTTITLPAATGSGAKFRFVVTVAPSSNQHRINVTGNDAFVGTINMIDLDAAATSTFAAGSDADQINLNTTTTGGKIGDWIEVQDCLADRWHVMGQLQVPSGSDDATPFATGQVS